MSKYSGLTNAEIRRALTPFGVNADDFLCERLRVYTGTLLQWNEKISLTSICKPVDVLTRHFGECMFAVSEVPIVYGRLADVGSGAGFPGLALKLSCPDLIAKLIEPSAKKSAFLHELVRALELRQVEILRGVFSDAAIAEQSTEFVTSRALKVSPQFLEWSSRVLVEGGQLILWTSDTQSKTIAMDRHWSWRSIPIPLSERRVLVIGQARR